MAILVPTVLVAMAVACSGDSEDSGDAHEAGSEGIQQYLEGLRAAAQRQESKVEALGQAAYEANLKASPEGPVPSEEWDSLVAEIEAGVEYLDTMGRLEPPSVVADAHARLVSAMGDLNSALRDLLAELQAGPTSREFSGLGAWDDLGAATEAFDDACSELIFIARNHGFADEFRCGWT